MTDRVPSADASPGLTTAQESPRAPYRAENVAGRPRQVRGLIFGIRFTAFLITFAGSFFAGFMTRGFALIIENGNADVWVMDPAVNSVEQTTNLPG